MSHRSRRHIIDSVADHLRAMAMWAVLVGLTGQLGGCAIADKPVRPAVYDFGPGELVVAASPPKDNRLAPLALAEIEANPALDSTALVYRLAYSDIQQLRPYAQARWSMPPAQLVRQRLRAHLSLTRAVLNPGEGVGGNAKTSTADVSPRLLRMELEEFSQVFESATRSAGLLRLRATVVLPTPDGEKLIAQREFTLQRPAPSADAAGGVRALTAATDAAVQELGQWLQQLR